MIMGQYRARSQWKYSLLSVLTCTKTAVSTTIRIVLLQYKGNLRMLFRYSSAFNMIKQSDRDSHTLVYFLLGFPWYTWIPTCTTTVAFPEQILHILSDTAQLNNIAHTLLWQILDLCI